jgi:taurine dioxygenase
MKTTSLGKNGFVGEIFGFDCNDASPADGEQIRKLLFEHRVLLVRHQQLTPERYQKFMETLGKPIRHVLQNLTVEGHPTILKISDYVLPDGSPFGVLDGGAYWHSDMSYLPDLGIATSLYAVQSSERCGGTAFVDLAGGRELLARSPELLELLGCETASDALTLEVVHRFGNRRIRTDRTAARQALSQEQHSLLTGALHRLLELHPVTGRIGLFAPAGSAMAIAGQDEQESARALDRLEEALLAACEVYTHHYRPGDLVIWDNMSTLHRGVGVSPTRSFQDSRLLHRINIDYAATA